MSDRVITTGPSGGSPNRLEIRDLIKNEKFFSLYIQALQLLQKEKESETVSYFQIGGIHSLPNEAWNGVVGLGRGGYCTHGTVLFPTWHRTYLSLYEQAIQDRAKRIAAEYTVDKAEWEKAANDLRQPYWDWAVNSVPPDEVITPDQVTIVAKDGNKVKVDNPLFRYAFQSRHFEGTQFSEWTTTHRYPETSPTGEINDDVDRLREVLTNEQESITTDTYHMLTRVNNWDAFSNHSASQDDSLSNSVESIHDNIHDKVGGGGNMSFVPVAGFDPVFYLHHCNVDRLLSLWSALHPDVWVTPGESGARGTRTIPPFTTIDERTDLTPFYNTSNTFWASAGISDTAKLGYSYPEFNGLDLGNKEAVKDAIGKQVKALYDEPNLGGSSAATNAASFALRPAGSGGGLLEWTARVESKQFELPISYTVLLFLGKVSDDTKEWPVSPYFVGSHSAFVNSAAQDCENCRNNVNGVIEGYVHLNQGILRHSGLQSLEPDAVIPYLTENLQWRVLKLNGERADLPSLEVTVYSTRLKLAPSTIFPDQEKPQRYDQITYGRNGGSRRAPGQ